MSKSFKSFGSTITLERPVWCPVCEKRLYYSDDVRFEPEYYITSTDPISNDKKFFYVHQACLHRFINPDALKFDRTYCE